MYTICINGASGSGKSTMAKELLKGEKTRVVHLDHLLNRLKRVLPEKNVDAIYRAGEGECLQLNKSSFIFKFISLKYVNNIYKNLRDLYVKRELKRIKEQAIAEGVRFLIVEGVDSNWYDEVLSYDYKIFVRAAMDERVTRIKKRDFVSCANPSDSFYNDFSSVNYDFYDLVIDNCFSLEEYLAMIRILGNAILEATRFARILEM